MSERMLEAALDEPGVCTCEDPFGLPVGYEVDCPGHVVHCLIAAVLNPDNPLAAALLELAAGHLWHTPPGPLPSPTGTCGGCGGTGEVFRGWSSDGGPVFEGECGCDTPYCGGCGDRWPCHDIRIIAAAAGVTIPGEDLP